MKSSHFLWLAVGGVVFLFFTVLFSISWQSFSNRPYGDTELPGWSEFPELPDAKETDEPIEPLAYKLSGPYTHRNLSVYLLHGQDRLTTGTLLTLPEALEQKKIVIHETQEVNQLAVENKSAADEILILSGDVLKGGQQDRVVQFDMLLPAKSGKVGLPAFCVEQTADRWMGEMTHSTSTFSSSSENISSFSYFSSSSRESASQGEVWQSVDDFQQMMGKRLNRSVRSPSSVSSLQLSLENEDVRKAAAKYTTELSSVLEGHNDVLGYAFVINGKVHGVDVYASSKLFHKVWPRLLRTNAVEAFAKANDTTAFAPVSSEKIRAFLTVVETGKCMRQPVVGSFCQYRQETPHVVLFEAAKQTRVNWVRRQYLPRSLNH